MGSTKKTPLSAPVLHILLALARSDLHGYGILQEVKVVSGGDYKIGPGTLYDNLRGLLAADLVSEFEEVSKAEARRMYHLTSSGQEVLELELKRLSDVVRAGRERLKQPQSEGAL